MTILMTSSLLSLMTAYRIKPLYYWVRSRSTDGRNPEIHQQLTLDHRREQRWR
jgi:hypothetical protein